MMIEFGGQQAVSAAFTFDSNYDADQPLPSIESHASSADSRTSTPNTTVYTPSVSINTRSLRHESIESNTHHQLEGLQDLRLETPEEQSRISAQADRSTPSIHVTPAVSSDHLPPLPINRSGSLADGFAALGIHDSTRTPSPTREVMAKSLSPRRRRSTSTVNKELYTIENECPSTSVYGPDVQATFVSAKAQAARLTKALSSSTLHLEIGSTIEKLYREAVRLTEFKLPGSQVVGLVGDSGVGKSSLINALLDKSDLARASSSGSACTCAVTEYIYHDRPDFVVEIDYFTTDELKIHFEELLGVYRDYEYEKKEHEKRQGQKGTVSNELEQKARLAKETFQSIFGRRLEEQPLMLTIMPLAGAVDTMIAWAAGLLPPQQAPETFSTSVACAERLKVLTSESTPAPLNVTPWPLIRMLRVRLNAYILSQGLIIADLPGLRDLNSARRAITERYVRKCRQVLVVARIDRAITDQSIKDIFELATAARLSKIDVVCTRSEDIRPQEARDDWPAKRGEIRKRLKVVADDVQEIQDLTEEIEDFDQSGGNLTREEEKALSDMQRDLRRIEAAKTIHEFELKSYIMELRNEKVTSGLRQAYNKYPAARNLNVFCVSNVMYWDNRFRPRHTAIDSLLASNIPKLRQHCIGIVSESRSRTVKAFVQDEIPAFLGSVELWVEAGSGGISAETKQQILDTLSAIESEIHDLTMPDSPVNMLSLRMSRLFEPLFQQIERHESRWSKSAGLASEEWRSWHHSSYRAFCSRFGDHWTHGQGGRSWNAEAMHKMKEDMAMLWEKFPNDLAAQNDCATTFVETAYENLRITALSGCARSQQVNTNISRIMRTLAATFGHQQHSLVFDLQIVFEDFNLELHALATDSLASIRTAFLGQLMEESYHKAGMEHGRGSDFRRKEHITNGFCSRSLFVDHRRMCKNRFRDLCQNLQQKVVNTLQEYVESTLEEIRILQDENVLLESERHPHFKRQLKDQLEDAKTEVAVLARTLKV